MKAKGTLSVAFLLLILAFYFFLLDESEWKPNIYSLLPVRDHHNYVPTSASKLEKCMEKFDFHIVDQKTSHGNQSFHPIIFYPHLRTPCWFEFFSVSDVNRLTVNEYVDTKRESPVNRSLEKLQKTLQRRLSSRSQHRNIRLRCLPFFVIIGQAKCGTTDLFRKLETHQQIEMGLLKEPDWWTRSVPGQGSKFSIPRPIPFSSFVDLNGLAALRLEEQVMANFCQERNSTRVRFSVIGEGSVATFSDPEWKLKSAVYGKHAAEHLNTAGYLHWVNPQARIIVILRDPVDRLISDYLFFDKTDLVSPADFHHRVVHTLHLFDNCRKKYGEKYCVNTKKITKKFTVNVHRGLYSLFLIDWLTTFGRDRLLVIRTEDYAKDELITLKSVFNFLQLEKLSSESEMEIRKMKIRNKTNKSMEPVWNSTINLLRNFYSPYNLKLAHMMKDNGFLWK